jgi:hypothetical protein
MSLLLTSRKIVVQPDSVQAVKDALAHISQLQLVQVSQLNPSDVTQQVQIEALPSVLVLHLKRFLYDAAADGIVKVSKPVLFAPELEIPLGTFFFFFRFTGDQAKNPSCPEIMAPVAGKPGSRRTTSYMVCYIIMATPRAAGTIRSTCFTGAETEVVWKVGCILMMKLFTRCDTRTCLESMATSE